MDFHVPTASYRTKTPPYHAGISFNKRGEIDRPGCAYLYKTSTNLDNAHGVHPSIKGTETTFGAYEVF